MNTGQASRGCGIELAFEDGQDLGLWGSGRSRMGSVWRRGLDGVGGWTGETSDVAKLRLVKNN